MFFEGNRLTMYWRFILKGARSLKLQRDTESPKRAEETSRTKATKTEERCDQTGRGAGSEITKPICLRSASP